MFTTLRTKVTAAVLSTAMAFVTADCQAYSPDKVNADTISTDRLVIVQSVARDWDITEDCILTLDVRAKKNTSDIVIRTTIPQGAEVIKTEPSGVIADGEIIWNIGSMMEGECRQIRLWVHSPKECELCFYTNMSHNFPMAASSTRGCLAKLKIEKSGPEIAVVGRDANYKIKVSNVGTATARNVVIKDFVPEGMVHSSHEKVLSLTLENLLPGESRTFDLCLEAEKRGMACNEVSAKGSNTEEVRAQACTDVHIWDISVDKEGTPVQFIGRQAEYVITVTNTGDDTLHGVVIQDFLPKEMEVIEAKGGEINAKGVRWFLDSIEAGASVQFGLTVRSCCVGMHCNQVKVRTCEDICASDTFTTEYRGHAALSVEAVDACDPLMTGDCTVYRIRVTNQGTAADSNIRVKAALSEHLKPARASGDLKGTVSGQNVSFEPCSSLAPGKSIYLEIRADAAVKGDGRIYIEVSSDMIKDPIKEEESTHVY